MFDTYNYNIFYIILNLIYHVNHYIFMSIHQKNVLVGYNKYIMFILSHFLDSHRQMKVLSGDTNSHHVCSDAY